MKSLLVYNNENLVSLKKFPLYFFLNKNSLSTTHYVPIIKERKTRLDYDTVSTIINYAKEDPTRNSLHVIILTPYDVLHDVTRDALFDVCSVLIENTQSNPNLQLIFIGFFPLPLQFSGQSSKVVQFQGKLRQFIKNKHNVTLKFNRDVKDPILRLGTSQRQQYVEQFHRVILKIITLSEPKLS